MRAANRRGRARALHFAAGVFAVVLSLVAARPSIAAERIVVAAAASTLGPLNEAIEAYGARAKDVRIVPIYASSGTLARQILAGSPARIFISANRKWMDAVAAADPTAAASRRVFVANALVLATRSDNPLALDLAPGVDIGAALGDGRLVTANPQHAPLGQYAREALMHLGAWKSLQGRLLRAADAAQARVMVERGAAAAGILYASDIAGNPRLRAVAAFPRGSYPAPVYELAVIAAPGAGDPAPARAFADWLAGPAAQAIFKAHGFLTAAEAS